MCIKGLFKVWVDKCYLFGDGSLNVVKQLLMDRLAPPWFLLGTISFGGLVSPHSPTKSVRGQHFTALCPHIPIVLDHTMELS